MAAMRIAAALVLAAMFARLGGAGVGVLPSAPVLAIAAIALLAISTLAGRGGALAAFAAGGWRDWARVNRFAVGLSILVVVALVLRLPSIANDLGHHPPNIDENRLAANVKAFLATGTVGYHTVEHYPGILFWILTGVSVLLYLHGLMQGAFATIRGMPVEDFILAGRLTSAVIGAATVAVVGLMGRRLAGVAGGLIAAGLFAFAPLAIQTTMTNRNDPIQVLLMSCAVLAAIVSVESDTRRWPVLAGACAGLATAVKYTSVFALVPALLAALVYGAWRERGVRASLALAAFGLAVAATNHFLWWDAANFVRQLSDQVGITGAGHWGAVANPSAFQAGVLARFGIGWPLLILGAAAGAWRLASGDRVAWVFWVLPILYSWFTTKVPSQFPRWVYPLLPFVTVAAAAAIVWVAAALRARFGTWGEASAFAKATADRPASRARLPLLASSAVATVLVALPIWQGIVDFSRRVRTPTHLQLEAWLNDRPAGERALVERGWLQLAGGPVRAQRVGDLRKTLDAGLYPLTAADWIVVPEPNFGHPALKQLSPARQFRADFGFAGRVGYDFEIYSPPALPSMPTPLEVRLDAAEAAPLLGADWSASAGPGRELPAAGASVFLPVGSGEPLPLQIELIGRGFDPARPALTLVDARGHVELTILAGSGSAMTLRGTLRRADRGRTTELRMAPEGRRARVRVVRVVAG
jgi:4-amino-4-deoxy-L-arabinose transferase-like glycosyltransferase